MWKAKDHLAHLAHIERAFQSMIERHLSGQQNPVGFSGRSREDVLAGVHRGNEENVRTVMRHPRVAGVLVLDPVAVRCQLVVKEAYVDAHRRQERDRQSDCARPGPQRRCAGRPARLPAPGCAPARPARARRAAT